MSPDLKHEFLPVLLRNTMPLTRIGGEFISLLTYLSVTYVICVVNIHGERIDLVGGAGAAATASANRHELQQPTTILPDEEISLDHIEKLCIEKCPHQVSIIHVHIFNYFQCEIQDEAGIKWHRGPTGAWLFVSVLSGPQYD